MKLHSQTTWYAALALAAVAVLAARPDRRPAWESAVGAAEQGQDKKDDKKKDEKKAGALPPLIIDTDSPLLLDEGKEPAKDAGPVAPSVAENAACFVCHVNFQDEGLVKIHAAGDTGCVDCHGKSYAHRNDENNTTPPEVMFPRDKIEDSCGKCHESHDAPAAKVLARLHERMPRASGAEQVVCTDCHGHHRLAHRTVVWDKATGKLLTGKSDTPATKAPPTLDAIKALAGTWVLEDEHGQPTEQVISTYRVTAAGSAVVEVMFEDTDHEMVTVYHQDGADLVLTHYCAAGNQPRMRCRAGSDPSHLALEFEFVDATNMRSAQDTHMHALTLTIVDPKHIQAKWQSYSDGKPSDPHTLNLVRQ